jgi:hypothetical protein
VSIEDEDITFDGQPLSALYEMEMQMEIWRWQDEEGFKEVRGLFYDLLPAVASCYSVLCLLLQCRVNMPLQRGRKRHRDKAY